ncbi:MAG: hypothetical protein LBR67_07030 [Dysgonamonadaceae bacterium]|nr:hypothetical protein [Dysgonamonadaceae bacterium]
MFAFYYVNTCFFYHSHIINGVTIVHSHIHSNSHAQTGSHSESELTLISVLSDIQSPLAMLFFAAIASFFILLTVIRPCFEKRFSTDVVAFISLRAPPYSY